MTHDYDPATYRCTCGEYYAYANEHLTHQIDATERPTKEKP